MLNIVTLIAIALGLSLIMTLAWYIQRRTGSSGWIDVIWSVAVGIGGVAAALMPEPWAVPQRRIAVGCLVAVWALRLGLHIASRTHGAQDDPRYAKLMRQWGARTSRNLFIFLQIQAVAAFVLVLAVRLAAINWRPFPSPFDIAGGGLLMFAILGEALADAQLRRFGKQNKGLKKVCDVGLWKWSRHPNYFFEWLGWVGWAVIALMQPWGWLALGAPILMYYLLVFASGIPPLEAHMLASRGDVFRAYMARTNAFFPGPLHKVKS